MTTRAQRVFAWSGPIMVVVFSVGFLIARFLPPPSPTKGPLALTAFFQLHAESIRIGMVIAAFACVLVAPWSVALSLQIKRISAAHSGYAYAELVLGAILLVSFMIPIAMWEGIALRPDVGPAITLRLNDVATVMFVGVVAPAVLEAILLGVAMLADRRNTPLFPRWIGYFNIVAGIAFIPGGFCGLTTTGVFSWNGFLSWWFPLSVFFVWVVVNTYAVLRAVAIQEDEERSVSPAVSLEPVLPIFTVAP